MDSTSDELKSRPTGNGVYQLDLAPSVVDEEFSRGRLMNDAVFGFLLPLLSIAFVIKLSASFGRWNTDRITNVEVFQFLVALPGMLIWLKLSPERRIRFAPIFAVWFFIAALNAWTFGMHLAPVTFLGVFYGVGIFGLIPFLTGYTFAKNCVSAIQRIPAFDKELAARLIIIALLLFSCPRVIDWFVTQQMKFDLVAAVGCEGFETSRSVGYG